MIAQAMHPDRTKTCSHSVKPFKQTREYCYINGSYSLAMKRKQTPLDRLGVQYPVRAERSD